MCNTEHKGCQRNSENTIHIIAFFLREIGVLSPEFKVGGTGQSAHYIIAKTKPVIGKRGGTRHEPAKPVMNPPNPSRTGAAKET